METLEIIQINLLASLVIFFSPLYFCHSHYQFIYFVKKKTQGFCQLRNATHHVELLS